MQFNKFIGAGGDQGRKRHFPYHFRVKPQYNLCVHQGERFRSLLDQFDPKSFAAAAPARPQRPFVERVGQAGVQFWTDVRGQIAFLGEAASALTHALRHPRMLRWGDILYVAEEAGVNALPIVALIGFLMGVILAFQSAIAMKQFGAGSSSRTCSRSPSCASSGRS